MKNIRSLVLIGCVALVSACSKPATQENEVAAPVEPNPICVEEAKGMENTCSNPKTLSIKELYRCHTLQTAPDFFSSNCTDVSLPNAAAMFILMATDEGSSGSIMKSSKYLREIKIRCDETPIKEFTIPEKEFCEDSLSMNMLEFMDDIEEQVMEKAN